MTALSALPATPATFPSLSQSDLRPVFETARRILGCDHLADDAVQEALVAMSQMDVYPDRPIAWLTQAVVHRGRHLRRTLQRRQHHEHVASQHCHLHGDCDNPLHVAIAHELGENLSAARQALPAEQRRTLDLCDDEGKSYQQIADQLHVPIGTVRSRLARAREALQRVIDAP